MCFTCWEISLFTWLELDLKIDIANTRGQQLLVSLAYRLKTIWKTSLVLNKGNPIKA